MIVVASALVHEISFNGSLFYAVLPCVPIITWFQAIAVNYKRNGVQLGLILAAGTENKKNSKEMIQDCLFLYRDNACIIPRAINREV